MKQSAQHISLEDVDFDDLYERIKAKFGAGVKVHHTHIEIILDEYCHFDCHTYCDVIDTMIELGMIQRVRVQRAKTYGAYYFIVLPN